MSDATVVSTDDDEYVCLALPHQDTLNYMFDAMNGFVHTVDLIFTAEGLSISKSDTAGMVHVKMFLSETSIRNAGGLYEYKTQCGTVDVCVNVELLSNVFKTAASQGDIVEIRIFADKPNEVQIIERNVNTGKAIKSEVKVIDTDGKSPDNASPSTYDSCITMESVEFYDNIKKLCITESKTVRFYCNSSDNQVMSLSSFGLFANTVLTIQLLDSNEALEQLKILEASTPPSTKKPRRSSKQAAAAAPASADVNTVPIDSKIMTVDPMESSSLERRFSCVKRGSALFCKDPKIPAITVDEDFPLAFIMRIAKAKAVSKYISILTCADPRCLHQFITLSFDTEIGCVRFTLVSKVKNTETRSIVPTPVFVADSLSKRVNEACKEKCNAIKRKRTRRVWSHKEDTAACSATLPAAAAEAPVSRRRKYTRKTETPTDENDDEKDQRKLTRKKPTIVKTEPELKPDENQMKICIKDGLPRIEKRETMLRNLQEMLQGGAGPT